MVAALLATLIAAGIPALIGPVLGSLSPGAR